MMRAVAMDDDSSTLQELPVIEMARPMPGFPEDQRFALVHLDDAGVLGALRSLDHDGLQFLVVPAMQFFPSYSPEIEDDLVAELGIASADDVLVLLVVHAGESLASTTVNLRAPLVINTITRRAAQVILDDGSLAVSAPLVA
jgi:flagellar assembly factor FliW